MFLSNVNPFDATTWSKRRPGLEETFAVLWKAALLCEDGALHEVFVASYKYPFSERSFDVLVARDSGLGREVGCWPLEGVSTSGENEKRYDRATVGLLHLTVTLCWVASVPETCMGRKN